MADKTCFLPGFDDAPRPRKQRVRPKRHGFDEAEAKVGPHGGVWRRGKGKGRRYEDITGLKFGLWTVIELSHYHERTRRMMWLCQCECGRRQVRPATELMRVLYIGCRRCKAERQKRKAFSAYFRRLKTGAKSRGYEFTVDLASTVQLLEEQSFRCALTGAPIDIALSVPAFVRGESTASLDRIDNRVGYVIGNIWWVHKDVNRMKGTLDVGRLVEIARQIVTTYESRQCCQSAG